eukprot:g21019.t1
MWEYFKRQLTRVQEWQVPARMKDRYGKLCESWMTKDVMILVKKKGKICEVQEDWRIANVGSLFKKGDRDNTGNYRPESLTLVEVVKMMDEGKAVDAVYMDVSKAFDEAPYGRLVQK